MIAAIAITAAAGLLIPIAWILTLALGIAAYFILPKLDLEYEYVFVNGELDIDKIMSKAKRKRAQSFDLGKMDIMAPVNSHRLEYQNHNTRAKVLDFSSGNPNHKVFAMFIPDEKNCIKSCLSRMPSFLKTFRKAVRAKFF